MLAEGRDRTKEVVQTVQQSDVTVTGLLLRFIVRDGLYSLPQAPCVSAVSEMVMGYPAAVSLHGTGRLLLISDQPHHLL